MRIDPSEGDNFLADKKSNTKYKKNIARDFQCIDFAVVDDIPLLAAWFETIPPQVSCSYFLFLTTTFPLVSSLH